MTARGHRREPEPRGKTVRLRRPDGTVVADRCLVANTMKLRLIGLLGRTELAAGDAILLRRSGSIHMFFMRFAIDAVFLSGDDVIIKVVSELRPWRAAASRSARSVLELASGEAEARGLSVGDPIVVEVLG